MKHIAAYILILLFPILGFAQVFIGSQASLKIDASSTLFIPQEFINTGIVANAGELRVVNDLQNQGKFAPIGTVVLIGTNQEIHFNNDTIQTLIVQGGGNKTLISDLNILHQLQLDNGNVIPQENVSLIVLENANASVGSETSYVQGVLYRKGTGTKYYPIGTANLFLPAELRDIHQNSLIGMSSHEFEFEPLSGRKTRYVYDFAYWKMDVVEGDASQAKISLAVLPQYVPFDDSTIVVHAPSPSERFVGIDADPDYESTIPENYVSAKDTAKGPIFAIGILLDVNWDLFYVPNALSKHAPSEEDRAVKVYGNVFFSKDFSFVVTNQWGNKVFETTSLSEMESIGWTGINNKTNRRESTGQYFYYLRAIAKDNTPYTKAGSLWIID